MAYRIAGALWVACSVYLAGLATWLLFHHGAGEEAGRSGLARLFSQVVAGMAIAGLFAFILAMAGVFSGWSYSACVIGYSLLSVAISRPRRRVLRCAFPSRDEFKGNVWPLLLLLVVGAALFIPPSMNMFGGADETVYPNVAAQVRRTGSVFQEDPVVPTVPDNRLDFFYKRFYEKKDGTKELLFAIQEPGFYLTDIPKGEVTPQFFFFYPSQMAVLMAFIGTRGGFLILALYGLISLTALYLIALEIMNRWAALLAGLFLAVNFLQVYFAKYSTAEMAMQAFFLSGLFFFIQYRRRIEEGGPGTAWAGMLSAACFGCTLLIHMEALLITVPLFAAYCYYCAAEGLRGITRDRVFLLTIAPFYAATVLLYFGPYRIYATTVVRMYIERVPGGWATVGAVTVAAFAAVALMRVRNGALFKWLYSRRKVILAVACVVLVLAVAFALFVRPALSGRGELPPEQRSYRAYYMPRLATYLTALGLLLALAGYCLFLLRGVDLRNLLIPLTGIFYTAVFVYQPMVRSVLAYGMRRFIPVAVPVAALMEAYALYSLWDALAPGTGRRWLKTAAGALCALSAAALIAWSLSWTVHIAWIRGFRYSLPVVSRVEDIAAGGGLIVCDTPSGRLLPAPLRCVYGRSAVKLRRNVYAADPWFREFVRTYEERGEPVYVVASRGSDIKEHLASFETETVGNVLFVAEALEITYEPSTNVVDFEVPLEVIRISAGPS